MPLEDDIVYLKILVFSFLCSLVVKKFENRDLLNGLVGLGLVLVVCRTHFLYSFGCVVLNLVLLGFVPSKYLHFCSFVATFGYLTFCRCAHYLNLPKIYPHANAVQLMMTLRCVGLAFEVHDSKKLEKNADYSKEDLDFYYTPVPNTLKAFLYLYNFVGLFTGPYYSYKVHCDMVQSKFLDTIAVAHEVLPRLLITPFYVAVCMLVDAYFPVEYVHKDQFYENHGLMIRFLYMAPVFVFLRTRVYAAWTLSECACIANGLGGYPASSKPKVGQGPTDLKAWKEFQTKDTSGGEEFSFETIKNVDAYKCEFGDGFRNGMREWNRSVHYWLAVYVYRRSPKTIRISFTMLVSAFWHGIHPGYYLSFLTIPLATAAEDLMFDLFKSNETNKNKDSEEENTVFDIFWWSVRMRGFEYMAMGFLLLSWGSTVRYWASIYYIVHIFLLGTVLFGYTYKYFKNRIKEE